MLFAEHYSSPIGEMLLVADDKCLVGLWIEGQKHFGAHFSEFAEGKDLPVFHKTKLWLDSYFSCERPSFEIPLRLDGTDFQKEVWGVIRTIPYGETVTYGDIAKRIAKKRGASKMSAQAVGNAVGRNPISVIVPCHRVIGSDGSLTGYAGGIDKKTALLRLEGHEINGNIIQIFR